MALCGNLCRFGEGTQALSTFCSIVKTLMRAHALSHNDFNINPDNMFSQYLFLTTYLVKRNLQLIRDKINCPLNT